MKASVSRTTLIAAYAIAICADLIEICLAPVLFEGFLNPFNAFVDVVVCVVLSRLIGFHVAFLPSFLIKLVPFVEIAPTWSLAVLIATRHLRVPAADVPPIVDVSATVSVDGQGAEPPRDLK